jgi:hypothetical protein
LEAIEVREEDTVVRVTATDREVGGDEEGKVVDGGVGGEVEVEVECAEVVFEG